MPKINWLDKLTDEQAIYAAQVAEKAQQMGVPVELALSVAYHESGFDPKRIGGAKEIGLMQVLPSTGKMLGYTPEQLADPAQNIEAGLKYLKSHLDTYQGAPEVAALAYNRGPGVADKFIAGESDKPGEEYVKRLNGLGAFSGRVQVEPSAPGEDTLAKFEAETKQMQQAAQPEQDVQAQKTAGIVGGGVGAGIGASRLLGDKAKEVAGNVAQYLGQRSAQGKMAAQQAAAGAAAAGTAPAAPAAAAPAAARATGPGSAVQNYATAFGLPEIEAQRALDMTKQEGGVHDLTTRRREALQEIKQRFPSETYKENPRFGGLMTPDYETFGGPRAPGAPRPAPIPAARSSLEEISQTFRNMMGRTAGVLSRVTAPLSLYSAGTEGVALGQEMAKPTPDIPSAVLSGLGAIGGGLSLYPPTAPIGAALGTVAPMMREQRQEMQRRAIPPEQMRQMLSPPQGMDMGQYIRSMGGVQ